MPNCPIHPGEPLERKRKGWFCEECGKVVVETDIDEPVPTSAVVAIGNHAERDASTQGALRREDITFKAVGLSAARVTRRRLRLRTSLGLDPIVASQRAQSDELLPYFHQSLNRAWLLLGDLGAGVSSLLANWVERLVSGYVPRAGGRGTDDSKGAAPINDVIAYMDGGASYGALGEANRSRLLAMVSRALGIELQAYESLQCMCEHLDALRGDNKAMVWLVFDGLDEADDYGSIISELDAFLPLLETYSWLRVVASMSLTSYLGLTRWDSHRGMRHGRVFENDRLLAQHHHRPTGKVHPFLVWSAWDYEESWQDAFARLRPNGHAARALASSPGPFQQPLWLELYCDDTGQDVASDSFVDRWMLLGRLWERVTSQCPASSMILPELSKFLWESLRLDVPFVAMSQLRDKQLLQRPGDGDPIVCLSDRHRVMGMEDLGLKQDAGLRVWRFRHPALAAYLLAKGMLGTRASEQDVTAADVCEWAERIGSAGPDGASAELGLCLVVEQLAVRSQVSALEGIHKIQSPRVRVRLLAEACGALRVCWGDGEEPSKAASALLAWFSRERDTDAKWELVATSLGVVEGLILSRLPRQAGALLVCALEVTRALGWLRDPSKALACVSTCNVLGDLARSAGLTPLAFECFREGVTHTADLASQAGASGELRAEVAFAYRRVAKLLLERAEHREASKVLDSALELASLTDDSEQALPRAQHLERMAGLLDLGELLRGQGDLGQAQQALEEGLRAARAAIVDLPYSVSLRQDKSSILRALGEVALDRGQPDAARLLYGRSVRTLRKWAHRHPQRTDLTLSFIRTLARHASLGRACGDDVESCRLYEESASALHHVVKRHPRVTQWRAELVGMLANLGGLLRQTGDDNAARVCLEDGLCHCDTLLSEFPASPEARRDKARILLGLVQLDETEAKRFEARQHVRDAVSILRTLAHDCSEHVDSHRSLALALQYLARLELEDGDQEGAETHLAEVVGILSTLLSGAPHDLGLQLELGAALGASRMLEQGASPARVPSHKLAVLVTDSAGVQVREYFQSTSIIIGRAPGSDLMLPNYSVSRKHAKITLLNDEFLVEDLESRNGVQVGGRRIREPLKVRPGVRVTMGDFILAFETPVGRRPVPARKLDVSHPTAPPMADDETVALDDAHLDVETDQPPKVLLSATEQGADAEDAVPIAFGLSEDESEVS